MDPPVAQVAIIESAGRTSVYAPFAAQSLAFSKTLDSGSAVRPRRAVSCLPRCFMRRVWVAGLLAAAVAPIVSSAVVARPSAQGAAAPGMPTLARMVVVNTPNEAVPVVLAGAGQVQPVTLIGTPSVSIVGEPALSTRALRQGWEYRTIGVASEQEDPVTMLNAAGVEGWEVVGMLPAAAGATRVLLKRPR
jgi:hypothetical protein